jgi:hypothetical protein
VSVLAVLIGQAVSLVAFDTTGLDRFVPGPVIYVAVPAALTAVAPAAVGARLYGGRRAALYAAAVFLAAAVVSLVTVELFLIG